MILTNYRNRGFTIVELLIVIVVIAILASITIVSYNGIQNRAKATSATSTAANVAKKAELANTLAGSYPSSLANFDAYPESKMTGSGLGLGTPTAVTGVNTVSYEYCSAGAALGGARIRTWDYNTGALSATYSYIGPATGGTACTTWAATLALTAGS
ncbi:Type IV pilin PilA [Candidatus Saccharibacteria bacterium RAAC3_TM7_1]|nr:Type IV pilin PilA [Candidatus Saccharibacteria bacterium RAAC3_TM7_1]HCZ28237.1 prepilin-type N-terminal cleavage/methylation domain-containing protein [Candidatus Saccharibacteria bacterium]